MAEVGFLRIFLMDLEKKNPEIYLEGDDVKCGNSETDYWSFIELQLGNDF